MGNYKYNNQLQTLYQRSSFLPMFCRVSMKDVRLSSQFRDSSCCNGDEPSSPKVSCMGQVKKRNSRVIGFPTIPAAYRLSNSSSSATSSATSTPSKNTTNHHLINYAKLKKLFSSKNLITAGSVSPKTRGSKSCRSSKEMIRRSLAGRHLPKNVYCRNAGVKVNISELDPPLPVVKKVQQQSDGGRDEVNLWKRRFGGTALKRLQIEQIHLPNNTCVPPITV